MAFGLAVVVAMVLLRSVLNMWAPESGPFALVYPAVMVATLFGRWQVGLLALMVCYLWAWYVVLPIPYSFRFEDSSDPARLVINAASALVVLLFAEMFRDAVRTAARDREAEIARRSLLLEKL